MKFSNLPLLVFSILLPQVIGALGAIITFPSLSDWYIALNKPPLNPPGWVFGPVWTALYFMMGLSLYLVLNKKKGSKAASIFYLQLTLNFFWSILFFGFQSIGGGLIVIIMLWIAIVATIRKFYKVSKPASYLLVPYLLWVTFASYLNIAYLLVNR